MPISRTSLRLALAGSAAVLATAAVAAPAQAESDPLTFACDFFIGETEEPTGSGTATAVFDTAIEDGLVVEVGDEVDLNPNTGSITLPEEFVTAIREGGVTSIEGGGVEFVIVAEDGQEVDVFFEFPETPVPAEGPLVVEIQGESDPILAEEEGTYTLEAEGFILGYGETEAEGGFLDCVLDDEDTEPTIDVFEAVAPTTPPSTTPPPTQTPERPDVVQTDFAGGEGPTALPFVLAGGTILVGAAGAAAARRTARRH